jgi:branched-chain amino acid transport system ATP-binding protein
MIDTVRRIRERGVSILIIEHVMRAIMTLSDRIVVLSTGKKLAEGSPHEVANNPEVITAYLGDAQLIAEAGKDT